MVAAAVGILRDWNAGKIPYYTQPPKLHPSTAANLEGQVEVPLRQDDGGMEIESSVVQPTAGDAILSGLGAAFDLDGLFASTGTGGEFEDEEWQEDVNQHQEIPEEEETREEEAETELIGGLRSKRSRDIDSDASSDAGIDEE